MLYPMMVDLENKKCVVFGGGEVALRKCREILRCGAVVAVYAKSFDSQLVGLAETTSNALTLSPMTFSEEGDLSTKSIHSISTLLVGAYLCFACTDKRNVNQTIADLAHEAGVWVNVSDAHGDSSFIVPSVRRKGEVTLSVYSGENPAASRFLADKLLDAVYESFLDFVAHTRKIRSQLKEKGVTCSLRQAVMKRIFFDGPAELAYTRDEQGGKQAVVDADAILDEALNAECRKKEGESHQ